MNSKQSFIDLVNYRKSRAYETLREVEKLLEQNMLLLAMNRIYYAGFYIVNALALLDNFSTSKHKQLIGYFNREYIKTGKISSELGRILGETYEKRSESDYSRKAGLKFLAKRFKHTFWK